ncbi:MAG: signal peptidase I [Bacilli bacterium]|nr:signal peptidase I [Bacilli bacterium]
MKKFWNTIKDYVYIILAVVLIRSFIVTPALVDGASMDETLKDGELVLINKFVYIVSDINRFDVVVVNNEHDEDKIIKRVIALPNEKIEYKDDVLYINDKEVKGMKFEHTSDFVYETKDDEYFVMGDNRDISKDSRMLGNFKSKDIVGKVNLRIFPFKKFGSIK